MHVIFYLKYLEAKTPHSWVIYTIFYFDFADDKKDCYLS